MSATVADHKVRSFDKIYIGGSWVPPATDEVIELISPTTEEVVATVPAASPADMDKAVAAARKAFDEGPWPRMSMQERADYLRKIADEVENRYDAIVESFTLEIGAPTGLSQAFTSMAPTMWRSVADLAEQFELEDRRSWVGGEGKVVREPVGVVATIIPWNGPVGNASLKMAPALAAGCTVVLKPPPEGPAAVLMLAEAIEAAGLPEGVISILPGGREVGEYLVTHPDVDKVAFTGSTAAGKRIMSLCGERIRPVTLELGGKSAGIILDDIPLDQVLPVLVPAGVINTGQVCAALTRVLAPRHRYDEVVAGIKAAMEEIKPGDPMDPETTMGPLVAERQRNRVEEYIRIGKEEGARVVTGGGRPEGIDKGWFVEPTLFADVDNSMRIAQEEIFGPVVVVIPFDDVEDAIRIANDSEYGLSGAVFAADTELAESVARRIKTGQISINSWNMCITEPFGGYKCSGLGREGGIEGLMPYFETKLIQSWS